MKVTNYSLEKKEEGKSTQVHLLTVKEIHLN